MENFDELALTWDNEPRRVERAKAIADEIIATVSELNTRTGFEYGCGTGLLSFFLQPHLKKIWLGDSSPGMLEVLQTKINKSNISNMEPWRIDLVEDSIPDQRFDLIYTLMTLHHIADLDKILHAFYDLLNPGGYLCIADLDKEDGSFHDADFTGHHGFDQSELSEKLERHGFRHVRSRICFEVHKKTRDGQDRVYPVFGMFGLKGPI